MKHIYYRNITRPDTDARLRKPNKTSPLHSTTIKLLLIKIKIADVNFTYMERGVHNKSNIKYRLKNI